MDEFELEADEAATVLASTSDPPDDEEGEEEEVDDDISGVSFALARAGKQERSKHVKDPEETLEKLISAQIEIARVYRGHASRKGLSNVFLENDPNIQEVESTIAPHESFAISEFSEADESVHLKSEEQLHPTDKEDAVADNIKQMSSVVEEVEDDPAVEAVLSPPPNTADAAKKAENAATNDVIKKYNQSVKSRQGSLPASPSQKYRRSPAIPSRPPRKITSKIEASIIIQKAWRRHIDMQVFRYYRDLIHFRGQGDPALLLKCINPKEATLLDAAAGIHVRFRLAGEKFPPNIYYKIYTHRPVIDLCANSPKDYTKPAAKRAVGKQVHNKHLSMNKDDGQDGWYARIENNGWRLVSDRLIYASMDPVTRETSQKPVEFHHVKLQRKVDLERKRRKRKIDWMKKMYKEGMLAAKDTDQETADLVEKAARGLVNTVSLQGPNSVMDWEVDELLQWTTALNFDDYIEVWKETATSNISEMEAAQLQMRGFGGKQDPNHQDPVDSFRLTRDSSTAMRQLDSAAPPVSEDPAPTQEWSAGNDVKATHELKSALQSLAA